MEELFENDNYIILNNKSEIPHLNVTIIAIIFYEKNEV